LRGRAGTGGASASSSRISTASRTSTTASATSTATSACARFAGALKAAVRIPDACFRWGGDEFAVLLAETDRGGAELVGRRLAASVSELCRKPDGEPITLSFGSAELLEDLDGRDLVAAADLALLILRDRTAAGETAGSG
jgi:GGDEF domain-containing protein